jgi:hypothetical protein
MSEAFFSKFTELLFGAIMIFLLFTSSIIVVLAYSFTQNMIFYYAYVGALAFSFVYALNYSRQFKDFKENLYLFIPPGENNKVEPLNIEVNDIALKVCLYYRNGATQEQIKRNLGLNHPTQVKRELVKGLTILLKEHNSKKVEQVG